jgi:glycosyltransferase involved in cell wall biosynthesis
MKAPLRLHLAFVVNTAAFFASHRLPIALHALRRGYKVDLYTGLAASPTLEQAATNEISRYPITHRRIRFTSAGLNPFTEAVGIIQLTTHLRRDRPDIVHCVTPKGVLYGGLAARLARVPSFVAAVSGQGYAFTDGDPSITRTIARVVYSATARFAFAHRNKRVIVQNADDQRSVIESHLGCAEETVLMRGSGIDLSKFVHLPIEAKQPIVLLPARMLRDKGILEFAEAARILKSERTHWRFLLAGDADLQNLSRITQETLLDWTRSGTVEWLGHVDDMPSLYATASIVCLPSYREGMPKSLLEAAAAGCAVITTDVAGCRDAIRPGVTGDLVPVRSPIALARAIRDLINDPIRRERYARAGREFAITHFSIDDVTKQTMATYEALFRHAAVG